MSKKYILRSKWFLSMAVLLLFATANAQEITKEKEPARFGKIGRASCRERV